MHRVALMLRHKHRQAKTTSEALKAVDKAQGRWARAQAPALRQEPQRREAGEVANVLAAA